MIEPATIARTAHELGISPRQVRRDIRAGAPVAQRGARGRGRQTLLDVAALAAWRRCRGGEHATDRLRVIASEVPEIVAGAIYDAFAQIEGSHKRRCAGALAAAWYLACNAILDRLRVDCPEIAEISTLPEKIDRLRHIFGEFGSVGSLSRGDRR